jgi:hypothetical protein
VRYGRRPVCLRFRSKCTWVKITLEGASDEEFVVNMPDTEFFVDPVNTGDMVRAYWKAADVHPLVGSSRSDRPHASGQN